jgi:hypothetical protein
MLIYSKHFIQNKYYNWYSDIIIAAKSRQINDGYSELHHIIPRCFGGSNKKDNIVRLTYREHFLCHWLLPKFTFDKKLKKKMLHALTFMIGSNNDNKDLKTYCSWQYEIAKKAAKHSMMGKNNNFYGKKHSEENLNKMRAGQKRHIEKNGRPKHTEETKEKLRVKHTGKKAPESFAYNLKKYYEENDVKWYNNGTVAKMIPKGQEIPEGFVRGRLKRNKKVEGN